MLVKTGLELHSKVYQSVIGINGSNNNVNSLMCCTGVSKAYLCLSISRLLFWYQVAPLQDWYFRFNVEVWKLNTHGAGKDISVESRAAHEDLSYFCWRGDFLAVTACKGSCLNMARWLYDICVQISLFQKDLFGALDTCTYEPCLSLSMCFCFCSTDRENEAGEECLIIEWSVIVRFCLQWHLSCPKVKFSIYYLMK